MGLPSASSCIASAFLWPPDLPEEPPREAWLSLPLWAGRPSPRSQ